jgi:hypothetical protein
MAAFAAACSLSAKRRPAGNRHNDSVYEWLRTCFPLWESIFERQRQPVTYWRQTHQHPVRRHL